MHEQRIKPFVVFHTNDLIISCNIYFSGCTGGVSYNGRELDEKFQFHRFRVVQGCPCASSIILDCQNNSTCADEDPPYCACPKGFAGRTCDQIVTEPTPRPRFTLSGK